MKNYLGRYLFQIFIVVLANSCSIAINTNSSTLSSRDCDEKVLAVQNLSGYGKWVRPLVMYSQTLDSLKVRELIIIYNQSVPAANIVEVEGISMDLIYKMINQYENPDANQRNGHILRFVTNKCTVKENNYSAEIQLLRLEDILTLAIPVLQEDQFFIDQYLCSIDEKSYPCK